MESPKTKHLNAEKRRYCLRRAKGLCPRCGGRRDNGWIQCNNCLEKVREAQYKIPKEKKAEYLNRYREKCRGEGICYTCGAWIGIGKYKRCQECRDVDSRRQEDARIRLILAAS